MKQEILDILEKENSIRVNKLSKMLKTPSDILKTFLTELKEKGLITKIDGRYYLLKEGTIQIKEKGFGFISTGKENEEDYYVSQYATLSSSTGDTVKFYVKDSYGGKTEAVVVDILKRKNTFVVGELAKKVNKQGVKYFVNSNNEAFDCICYIDEEDLNGAVVGNIVSAEIVKFIGDSKALGKITKILGYIDDPGMDISIIAAQHNFFVDFPEDVIKEIKSIPNHVDLSKYKTRKDFRDKTIITIDGDDSKDFDDAVTVEILPNGNYYLGVYIADVAEYVKEGTPLNREALNRATSVYLADRVIPMLPQKLSNGICSLNEKEDRLVLACEMEYLPNGTLVNYEINEGIIKSAHRMTYNKVNKMLNNDETLIEEYSDIYPMIKNMEKLSKIIRGLRTKKGAIDFDVPEYKVVLDKEGKPLEFILRERDTAEMLIEDFMLAANETVAYHMSISNLPCVYRIHETPDTENVAKVYKLINTLGYKVLLPKNKILPKDIQKTMNLVKNGPSFFVVNQLMLRSMAKAKYSEKNVGHYGLAMQYYCHFTSPIRRYPDLMVHRLIKELIIHPTNFENKIGHYSGIISDIADRSSIKEREAIDCERQVVDMLMAEFMESHISEEFEGIIDSITKFGMFVLLDNGVEGLVHISNMDGYFTFNEEKMQMISSSVVYNVGQRVKVMVIGASKQKQKVDFVLINN